MSDETVGRDAVRRDSCADVAEHGKQVSVAILNSESGARILAIVTQGVFIGGYACTDMALGLY